MVSVIAISVLMLLAGFQVVAAAAVCPAPDVPELPGVCPAPDVPELPGVCPAPDVPELPVDC